ncbi:MAG: lipopolysaccharide export system protein LptC [Yoonia sp.]|jgi:lipopolysaccharide export system protein LptC
MMATEGNFYSWLVGWVKIILPMLALALLSTLFLFARSPSETSGIPLAQLEELAREQQITAPQFSGVTDDGSVIAIAAKNAKPDAANPQNLLVENFSFDMDATDGTTLNITSGMSVLNSVTRTARLNGLSRVTTSSGYTMETVGISANLRTGEIVSDGPLAVRAPFGELSAGKVRISVSSDGTGQQMVFTQGVRLLYTPEITQP